MKRKIDWRRVLDTFSNAAFGKKAEFSAEVANCYMIDLSDVVKCDLALLVDKDSGVLKAIATIQDGIPTLNTMEKSVIPNFEMQLLNVICKPIGTREPVNYCENLKQK